MENDQERPYSVVTRDYLKEKMKKQIEEITELFGLSRSDATVLLMHLRWDSAWVSDRLSDDQEKLLVESGLKSSVVIDSTLSDTGSNSSKDSYFEFAINNDEELSSDPSCEFCFKTFDESDLTSTPICSHKFCPTCWGDYLLKSMDENKTTISCPYHDCEAVVGPETVEKQPVWVRDIYDRHTFITFLKGRSTELKLCPSKHCKYSIEFRNGEEYKEEYALNVVCLCGFTFCWKCEKESHRPVTCNNAADWLDKELKAFDESSTLSWIEANTRPCPSCLCPVFLEGRQISNFVTCTCSASFCSKCLVLEEAHQSWKLGPCIEFQIAKSEDAMDFSCLERWEEAKVSMEKARTEIKAFEERINKKPGVMKEEDVKTVREGLMLLLQCRQFLKWTCVYDHFHTGYEISKKEYLRFLQQNASDALQTYLTTLKDETGRVLYANKKLTTEELCNLRCKLSIATSDIGNYFYHFIKTLKDGLVDVKVKSYNGVGGPHWFCDRCSFGNKWTIKACTMCCDPTLPPMEEELSDLPPMEEELSDLPPLEEELSDLPLMEQELSDLPLTEEELSDLPPLEEELSDLKLD